MGCSCEGPGTLLIASSSNPRQGLAPITHRAPNSSDCQAPHRPSPKLAGFVERVAGRASSRPAAGGSPTPRSARLPRALPEVTACTEPQSRASIGAVLRLALRICHRSGLGLQHPGQGGPQPACLKEPLHTGGTGGSSPQPR